MTIAYVTKVNKRTLGNELLIVNEAHIIGTTGVFTNTPNEIRLYEVPLQETPSSIAISGFTEVDTAPGTNEFQVDYANGRITFNASRNGESVFVTYKGRGSQIDAEDVNELQIPVGVALDPDGEITAGHVKPVSISTNPADNFTFPNDVTITGNLDVQGTLTTIQTETVTIDDNKLLLNSNVTGSPTEDSGFEVERGTDPNVEFIWNETADSWQLKGTAGSALLEVFDTGDATLTGALTLSSILSGQLSSADSINYDIDSDNDSTSEQHVWRTDAGTVTLMTLDENGDLNVTGNVTAASISGPSLTSSITSNTGITYDIDADNNSSAELHTWRTDSSTVLMTLDEAGLLTVNGNISATDVNATNFNGTHNGNVVSSDISNIASITFGIDSDNDSTSEAFIWQTNGSTELARIDEDGDFKVTGRVGINIDPIATFHNSGSTVLGLATATDPASISVSTVDNNTGIVITTTGSVTVTLPSPTDTTLGRFFTVLHASGSTGTLSVDGSNVGVGKGSTFMWDGSAWIPVGATGGFETIAGDPASPVTADVWFDTTTNQFKGYNGTDVIILG